MMEEKKILNQFAAKISKAKILHDNAYALCHKLRREAAQLQKQYQSLVNQRKSAEIMQQSLRHQLQLTKKVNKQQNDKCHRQTRQLNQLRKNKTSLKRQKDIAQSQLLKNTLQLQELVQQRQQLQNTAKNLSEKLQGVTMQKQILIQEYQKTNDAIKRYNKNIDELKDQIKNMKDVISKNTIPIHNYYTEDSSTFSLKQ